MPIPENYLEKIYAGLLGKCVGIRIGAPVEPTIWTYDRIRKTYGTIRGYVKDYKNFAADDDFNGPVFFIRALVDHGKNRPITARDIGRTWLNYAREEKGFYWWGGYGRSTEHTAYMNLKSGLDAPASGSIETNGAAVAEQIGGQIFIDTWGLVCPSDIQTAAAYGEMAASVSHDGNGMYGGRFMAAAVSKAFDCDDVPTIIQTALSVIPADSEYARVVKAVVDFHAGQPGDWRVCMDFLTANFGYDRYPGVCHIIPNAGVCILALLYGGGNLSTTVEIATMCGWDTDCNAGNVGTIVAVAKGLGAIEDLYRKPISDFVAASSVAGSLNIVDLPTLARQLALIGYKLAGTPPPKKLVETTAYKDLFFDFDLPGSTHGFRSDSNLLVLQHADLPEGGGALEVLIDRVERDSRFGFFFKPFYRRSDFDDERYSPAFSPLVYSGQTMSCRVKLDRWSGRGLAVIPYARETSGGKTIEGPTIVLEPQVWTDVSFTLPDTEGSVIDELGFKIEVLTKDKILGTLLVDEFRVRGPARYAIDIAKQFAEFATITPGTVNNGAWTLENGKLMAMSVGTAEFYTGNYYTADVQFSARVRPLAGEGHGVLFRSKGVRMGYAAAFTKPGKIAFFKNEDGLNVVEEKNFPWAYGVDYRFEVMAVGDLLTVSVAGKPVFELRDNSFEYGMLGFCRTARGRCEFGNIEVRELDAQVD